MPPRPVLFRLPGLPAAVRALYAAAEFCEIRELPWSLATPSRPVPGAAGFGSVRDLRDFAFDPRFERIAMIDYFLHRLGLDPAAVPAARRRNTWLASRLAPRLPRLAGPGAPGYVLICPHASMALRTMPAPVHRAVLRTLADLGVPAATQGEPPPGLPATEVPADLALAELAGWVAGARLVVTTDTATVHLADAYARPCLAVFTTHRPEWRARDYPLCRALYRPAAGLPPSLEFARGPADEAAAAAAWLDGGDARWLTDALAAEVAATGGTHARPGRT